MKKVSFIVFFFFCGIYVFGSDKSWNPNPDSVTHQIDSVAAHPADSAVQKAMRLNTVTVTASNMVHYADRDVVRITREMRKQAANTAQLLGAIPGIDCDYSDNSLSYYGSKNIIILVDSLRKPADYIKELHHLRFDRVEIVPNPDGIYSGYDVLINLHTKEDYEGFESNLSNYMRVLPSDGNGKGKNLTRDNASVSFDYTRNKWNFTGMYRTNFNHGELDRITRQRVYHVNRLQETALPSSLTDGSRFQSHRAYVAVDHQFNRQHSISLSYNYIQSRDRQYGWDDVERLWLDGGKRDTLGEQREAVNDGYRHTLGMYYRGNTRAWNYVYDFNYTYNVWETDDVLRQSTGYLSEHYFRNRMNYVWSQMTANRRFFDNRFYISFGYSLTWKDYRQRNRLGAELLNENSFLRNRLWTWMSYRFENGTQLTFSASAENVRNKTRSFKDNNMVYGVSSTMFHRWSDWLWMRVNYWFDVSYPTLEQVTSYGYFTDSLTFREGNPRLETNKIQRGRIWLNFFNSVDLQVGGHYSPDMFSTVSSVKEGLRPGGSYGPFVAYAPQNVLYKEWWASIAIKKKVGDFTLSGFLKYQDMVGKFNEYRNRNNGFSGNAQARYYNTRRRLTMSLGYYYNRFYGVSAQGWNTRDMDYFSFVLSKNMLKQRLRLTFQYTLPVFFTGSKYTEYSHSAAQTLERVSYISKTNANALSLTVAYRFMRGKSVRKYDREMQGEI